jgi:hypothetical protein
MMPERKNGNTFAEILGGQLHQTSSGGIADPPVEEPPNRPPRPPVREPGRPPAEPPPPGRPPVEEPSNDPPRPPVKEPPPATQPGRRPEKSALSAA